MQSHCVRCLSERRQAAGMQTDSTNAMIKALRAAGKIKRLPRHGALAQEPSKEHPAAALELVGPVPLPMRVAERTLQARWYVAAPEEPSQRGADRCEHLSVVAFGNETQSSEPPLVRIHSTCFTGDVLGSLRCDCGPQLDAALLRISESAGGGMVVYLGAHEGRGIGLWSKAAAYLLQDEGRDTYQANHALGYEDDLRSYQDAAIVIRALLGDQPFRLLTNNPNKVSALKGLGFRDIRQENHIAGVDERNCRYLRAKREHGHSIPASVLTGHSDGG